MLKLEIHSLAVQYSSMHHESGATCSCFVFLNRLPPDRNCFCKYCTKFLSPKKVNEQMQPKIARSDYLCSCRPLRCCAQNER